MLKPSPSRTHPVRLRLLVLLAMGLLMCELTGASTRFKEAVSAFEETVRPLISNHCLNCHSSAKQKGDLDLEKFASLHDIIARPADWVKVAEQVSLGEMPPKTEEPLAPGQRMRLLNGIETILNQAALARADDPGPVVLRKLNNAEYNYTIQDITGLDSLNPTREFPSDNAGGEGFLNTGQSYSMSPVLFAKYMEAAREIADHILFTFEGFRFSPYTTRRDQTEELLSEIRSIYRKYTRPEGGDKVNLQGIVFETNQGGRLPLESYLRAAVNRRMELDSAADEAISRTAAEFGLSPKYLRLILDFLNQKQEFAPFEDIRGLLRSGEPDAFDRALSGIEHWQGLIWKFNKVGHIGKVGGPKSWMEPVTPSRPGSSSDSLKGLDAFRALFPAALCYEQIVPVDEVVTLTLFHREDEPLMRLMLDERESEKLDALWRDLHYVSRDALQQVDVFEQLWQYATQDADPSVFEPLRQPILDRAESFKARLARSKSNHLESLLGLAEKAYRRSLTTEETEDLVGLYQNLHSGGMDHEESIRVSLTRVLTSPRFLYRVENSPEKVDRAPVTGFELATRLSYFLWASTPDDTLMRLAESGELSDSKVLSGQIRRMLNHPKIERLAREFALVWLQVYDFDALNEKSERHFPDFKSLQADLKEEVVQYFTHLFREDGSLLSIWESDHSFLNRNLAEYYQVKDFDSNEWIRVNGMAALDRGGVLGFGAILAKQSGASRTSPILRGNWISEVLLGEKLPRPPKNVPPLPETDGSGDLTVRQLTERHSNDPNCSGCHSRIDGYGFALEHFDAIGRRRIHDSEGREINSASVLFDQTHVDGPAGLRRYLVEVKRELILRQFAKKLLGYALGRGVMLSDSPLLDRIMKQVKEGDYRFGVLVEGIVMSDQFRSIRGLAWSDTPLFLKEEE